MAGLLPERDAGPLRHGAEGLLLRVIVQSALDLAHEPVKVRVRLLCHALGQAELPGVHDTHVGIIHVGGHALHELVVRLHGAGGVPLVLSTLADLREPANLFACARQCPGDRHARRGAVDKVLPVRLREAAVVYLRSVSFHCGHLHVLLKAAHLRSER